MMDEMKSETQNPKHKQEIDMNTATVLKQDRANFEAHLFRLMFEDGNQ